MTRLTPRARDIVTYIVDALVNRATVTGPEVARGLYMTQSTLSANLRRGAIRETLEAQGVEQHDGNPRRWRRQPQWP